MKRYHEKKVRITGLYGVILFLFLLSCTPTTTILRNEAFNMYNSGFMLLPEYSGLKKVVELPKLTVHVVGDRKDFNWEKARNPMSGIAAYANTNGEIWVLGRMSDGKIMVNWVILGHELSHILRFHDPEFADPDNKK